MGATSPYQFIEDPQGYLFLSNFENITKTFSIALAFGSYMEEEDDINDVIDLDRITKLSDDLAKNYKKWYQVTLSSTPPSIPSFEILKSICKKEMELKVESRRTMDRKRRFNKEFTPRKDNVHKVMFVLLIQEGGT